MSVDHDLLLLWCSERASGSLQSFRQAYEWLEDLDERPASGSEAPRDDHWTWTLRSLQALGHVEVDWLARRWHVAPPVVTTLTDGGGFALLCGARPAALLRRLDGLADDQDPRLQRIAADVMLDRPIRQDDGPALRLLQIPDPGDARQLCSLLGVAFVDRAADRLLRVLPRLNELLISGARVDLPGGVAPSHMTGMPDQLFSEIDHDAGECGSYELRLYDSPRYFHRAAPGRVFEAERGAVVYAELRRTGKDVLRYEAVERSLLVPPRLRLPALYERAAVLRSGLLPRLERVTPRTDSGPPGYRSYSLLRYVNIDQSFAERLADLMGQHLQYVNRPPLPAGHPKAGRDANDPTSTHHESWERR